tara:strand:- start:41 stop:190 length:150 start_codon:yes stop_codon:yes gene_type:complete
MTLEEVDKIIQDLRQQIPNLQMQLHQAEGYKQALVDLEKGKEEKETIKK